MNKFISFCLLFILVISCQSKQQSDLSVPSLKEVYSNYFLIGTALNRWQIMGKDQNSIELTKNHFNAITAENIMKWERIHPELAEYNFGPADSLLTFCKENNMEVIGHTLVWHNQTPAKVFEDENGDPVDRETLLARVKDHIFTVVERYKGQVKGWDVVNEAFDDQGNLRNTKWRQIIGDDFIEKAFEWAHEADPDAELYYNDFNMWHTGKRDAVIAMVKDFQSRNIPIHGIGMQGHWGLDYPQMDELNEALKKYSETGLKIMITEMDIRVLPFPDSDTGADITKNFELQEKLNPYKTGLPDSMQVKLSERYSELFDLFLKYKESISRVTLWGVHDGVSWCNGWPVRGRTDYPLLFDRNYQPKKAFYEVVKLVSEN